ncbi:MAG: ABC transporter ATP-binding protein [Lachnospiraceae bacterium]|nr:ABC transporter ATP-binding protein [Lachnospiraceae bacterium]
MSTILEIKDLHKSFSDNPDGTEVLSSLDLEVEKNEFLCILGHSGCGKTTLLRCIAGFESFTGQVILNGSAVTSPSPDRIMVFQTFEQLFPWKTVFGNVDFPLKQTGHKDKAERKRVVEDALKKVRLSEYAHYYPHQLSGGMKQRVAIARALALKPKLILMDEPFAALDAMTRRELQNELLLLSQTEDCTILFVTHNIQEAIILGTRNIVLHKGGKIVYDKRNDMEKPISPSSEGFGRIWQEMRDAIYME